MLIAILLGFIFSLFLVFTGKVFRGKFAILSAAIPLILFIYFAQFIGRISNGEVITEMHSWVPSFGVGLGFTLDGLSLLFSLMITGVGFLVFLYTAAYLKNHKYLDRFYGYLSMFMAAMLGLVLSDNLISLFVFWELTSISSFFLIGFNNSNEASRKSAITALSITGLGGLALLVGAIFLGVVTGTYSIAEMLNSGIDIGSNSYYSIIVVLIFVAAFTKSAQFPFHFWLPGAMKAPTPVSTYLHSATMVKAGIYLLMRLTPVLGAHELWNSTLIVVGAITMVYSAVHTIFRTDLKGILAYSTISALGILVFLIGQGTTDALLAASVFIIVHALYKATLFLMTGVIDLQTGTRDTTVLRGLRKVLFPVAIAGFLAAISSAGIPPSIGFLGKELTYESTLHFEYSAILLIVLIVITKILLLYSGFVAGIRPFAGKLPERFEKVRMPSPLLWMPPLLLAVTGIVFGVFPGIIESSMIKPVVSALGKDGAEVHLQLWHGFNTILWLSVLTIVIGTILYFLIKPTARLEAGIAKLEFLSPKSISLKIWVWFTKFSDIWTNFFQNGYLRSYVSTILVVLIALTGYSLYNTAQFNINFDKFSKVTIYEAVISLIMLVAIFYTVFTRSRLAAVASMGVIGYAICLLFVFYSAPDLAMTQFSIDTLTVILFVLVLYKLPKYLRLSDYKTRIKDGVLSLAVGAIITVLVLEVLAEPVNGEVSDFYANNAYLLAHGKNVVNVILVDFRGADTMIEISVLSIAAIGVFGLLKLRLKKSDQR
ncbi:putative monovalent cation/H+ antiporter subunit A [Gillisia sp. M10.2A]|uniref:Monovalent cation/H+ antiporter subunit A n=1 Tax=Gillisia lutea TaxID=2909668 RepID=A0ABS9EF16_9FLAO|nr:putative monovalent cation/H+ antiporter subunit A [Gillisia lutea]MCF4100469.1 putative monovalent cation/H+ antiporter subunit A [Gillisia lutea]